MWKQPFDIKELKSFKDNRGFLFEILRFKDNEIPADGQLYTFSIEPKARRGDHFHKKKQEWFTCVFGKAIILLSDQNNIKVAMEISSSEPKIVYSAPFTAHALINKSDEPAIIVSYGSIQHDPNDEDTFKQIAFSDYKF